RARLGAPDGVPPGGLLRARQLSSPVSSRAAASGSCCSRSSSCSRRAARRSGLRTRWPSSGSVNTSSSSKLPAAKVLRTTWTSRPSSSSRRIGSDSTRERSPLRSTMATSAARRPSPKLTFTPTGRAMRRMAACACRARRLNASWRASTSSAVERLSFTRLPPASRLRRTQVSTPRRSVRLGEDDLALVAAGPAAADADGALGAGALERDAARRGLRLLLDGLLAGGLPAVRGVDEAVLDALAELVEAGRVVGVLVAVGAGALQQRLVERRQRRRHALGHGAQRHRLLRAGEAVGELRHALLQVLGADLEAQRHALLLPLVELAAGAQALAVVDLHAHALLAQRGGQRVDLGHDARLGGLVVGAVDGQHHHLVGRQLGRHDQALVVAVGHDDRA